MMNTFETRLSGFQKDNFFLMLAFDHRGSFKKMMQKYSNREITDDDVIVLKEKIIRPLLPYISGTLVDQDYGLPAYKKAGGTVPYVLPTEKTGYVDTAGERLTEIEYDGESIIKNGGTGVKLLLYVNHSVASFEKQLTVARTVAEDASKNELPYFLEFVVYEANGIFGGTVYENVQKAIEVGIVPTVWKLAYPGSQDECKKIQEVVGTTPWILLTGGTTFETFLEEYKEAVAHGARGFLAGRALWQEAVEFWQDEAKLQEFLSTTLVDRFKQLIAISK